jgi:predicted Fe-Mo cluster-binding NifX family protein
MAHIVCIPVMENGQVEPSWGRAPRVALATVENHAVEKWEEMDVHWDSLHDQDGEGQHHARIAKFLMEHHVTDVAASHMGPGMERMLGAMRLNTALGIEGNAHQVVENLAKELQ